MPQPLFVLAHGAGAPSSSAWMQRWKRRLERIGTAVAFDYPYVVEGRKRPDRLPRLLAAHHAALRRARMSHPRAGPVVLVGKSMGGRVGCHLALEEPVDAVVCLGYPLRARGRSGRLRDEVLVALRTPILFVQGTRDRLTPLDELAAVRARMKARNELFVVKAGDHSLQVTKAQLRTDGETQEDADVRVAVRISRFLGAL